MEPHGVPSWSCLKAVYKPVWHIPSLSVQWINSRWWTEELSETCRISRQNKFVKLVHLVGFIIKKFVTMQGHKNVKFVYKHFMTLKMKAIWSSRTSASIYQLTEQTIPADWIFTWRRSRLWIRMFHYLGMLRNTIAWTLWSFSLDVISLPSHSKVTNSARSFHFRLNRSFPPACP